MAANADGPQGEAPGLRSLIIGNGWRCLKRKYNFWGSLGGTGRDWGGYCTSNSCPARTVRSSSGRPLLAPSVTAGPHRRLLRHPGYHELGARYRVERQPLRRVLQGVEALPIATMMRVRPHISIGNQCRDEISRPMPACSASPGVRYRRYDAPRPHSRRQCPR